MSVTTTSTTSTAAPARRTTITPAIPATPPTMKVDIKQRRSSFDFTVTFTPRLVAPNDTIFRWFVPDDKSTINKRRRTDAELFVRAMSGTSGIISSAKLRHTDDGGSMLTFTILGNKNGKKALVRLNQLAQKYLGITDVTFSHNPA